MDTYRIHAQRLTATPEGDRDERTLLRAEGTAREAVECLFALARVVAEEGDADARSEFHRKLTVYAEHARRWR